jgi:hypothetical protein
MEKKKIYDSKNKKILFEILKSKEEDKKKDKKDNGAH